MTTYDYYASPFGRMLLTADDKAITSVSFAGQKYAPRVQRDWTRDGDAYTVKLRFYRYNPDGSFSGTSVSTLSATLSGDGSRIESARSTQVLDVAGNVLTTVCAGEVSTRPG